MNGFIKFVALSSVIFTLAACGKTSDQAAQDSSKDLIAEHNQLAQYMSENPVPNAQASDQEIAEYGKKLDRLEATEHQLADLNGTHGITIFGGTDNSSAINVRRQMLNETRAQKRLQPKSLSPSGPSGQSI